MLRALKLLLIVHTIVAVERELDFDDYVITTDDNVLKSIRTTGSFTNELNLSNLGLVGLDENAFDYNLKKLLRLNLANNWLTSLPEFVFSNLTNLEYLSLSDNNLTCCLQNAFVGLTNLNYLSLSRNNITCCLENNFVGLRNLKLLDISENRLTQLESNYFVGLTNSPDILINENFISNMSTRLFEDTYLRNKPSPKVEEVAIKRNVTEKDDEFRVYICYESLPAPNNLRIKRVDIFNTSELLTDCDEAEVDYAKGKLFLRNLRTGEFDENWYGLKDFPINSIYLSVSMIYSSPNLTLILKNLPQNIKEVTFTTNYGCYSNVPLIRIENENLRSLNLEHNCIRNINPSAFEKTNLTALNLTKNSLQDLGFLATLPSSLVELDLSRNELRNILPDTFSELPQLVHLSLARNYLEKLPNQLFRGLSSLQSLNLAGCSLNTYGSPLFQDLKNLRHLSLANNYISSISKGFFHGLERIEVLDMSENQFSKITPDTLYGLSSLKSLNLAKSQLTTFEPTPFQDLKNLRHLNLADNRIGNIPKGLFTGLERIEVLDMTNIRLSKITNNTLYGLPDTLSTVILDRNEFHTLGNNSFVRVPKHTLSLVGCGVNYITSGSFNLPRLQELRLSNNQLHDLSSWGNLKGLKRLFLASNEITTIKKGATANMGRLEILDLSSNGITRLENGALFGLPKLRRSIVRLNKVRIKLIQGGVFDHKHGN